MQDLLGAIERDGQNHSWLQKMDSLQPSDPHIWQERRANGTLGKVTPEAAATKRGLEEIRARQIGRYGNQAAALDGLARSMSRTRSPSLDALGEWNSRLRPGSDERLRVDQIGPGVGRRQHGEHVD